MLPISYNGCSKTDPLQPLQQFTEQSVTPNQVALNFCTDPAYEQKQYLKTIIILDHSGSNQMNYKMATDGTGAPDLGPSGKTPPQILASLGTDPSGDTRYGSLTKPKSLINYLANLPANDPVDPTKFFALIDFEGDPGSQVVFPANSTFTPNIPAFSTYVQQDKVKDKSKVATGTPTDLGSTDYTDALVTARRIITADIDAATRCAAGAPQGGDFCPVPGRQVASSYVIVFMSDGSPITAINGISRDSNGNLVVGNVSLVKQLASDIIGDVDALTSLTANSRFVTSVNLFTIYYFVSGNVDNSGQALLSNMAKAGNGIAYSIASGSTIDYNQFQPPKKRIKYTLADVFVTNASVTWWTDGQLHRDTDMDGLPDDVELTFGSNPNNPSSDGSGISDFVRYQLSQNPAVNYGALLGLCGGDTRTASDPNGLNNCEKRLLGDKDGVGIPDSNGDLIPDWLEFKNGLPFQVTTAPAINVRDQDGFTIYQKIKWSLPVTVPSNQILSYTPATYDLNLVSTSDIQDCYRLNVSNLPTLGPTDTVRVDLIEKSELLGNQDLYRVGKKKFTAGSLNVNFKDWNDPGEIATGTWSKWP